MPVIEHLVFIGDGIRKNGKLNHHLTGLLSYYNLDRLWRILPLYFNNIVAVFYCLKTWILRHFLKMNHSQTQL